MAKKFNGNIKLASAICRTGAQPLDDSTVVSTVDDLYAFSEALYEGMMVVVNADHSIYVLTDVSKVGQADGWKKIGDASGDITNLQTQITANKTAAAAAKTAADEAKAAAAAAVQGVVSSDKFLSEDSNNKISADVSLSYDSSAKKLYLYGKNKTAANAVSTIDCSSFVKDGMLKGSALYKATAATGTVTIGGESYSLSGLTSGKTYIVLVWNADASKDPMTIDVTSLIDTYTAGDGLTLAGNEFSIDKSAAAQYIDVIDPEDGGADVTLQEALTKLQGMAGVSSIGFAGASYTGVSFKGDVKFLNPSVKDARDNNLLNIVPVNDNGEVKTDGTATALAVKFYDATLQRVKSLGGLSGDVTFDNTSTADGKVTFAADSTGNKISASIDASKFATAAQGAKADSAVQTVSTDSYIGAEITNGQLYIAGSQELSETVDLAVRYDEDENGEASGDVTISGKLTAAGVTGISTPTADSDAANKAYVDTKVSTAMSSAMTWASWN